MASLNSIFNFLTGNILTRAELFVGLIILLGYILQRKKWYECVGGFFKGVIGYLILMVGADTGIACNSAFLPAVHRSGSEFIDGCRDCCYFSFRQFSPRSFLICFMRSLISAFRSGVHLLCMTFRICSFCSSVLGRPFLFGGS